MSHQEITDMLFSHAELDRHQPIEADPLLPLYPQFLAPQVR